MKAAVFGNLTVDEIEGNGVVRFAPGGSALYVSATSAYFGIDVSVVANIGPDYPRDTLAWLKNKGIDVSAVRSISAPSTRFRLTYRNASRKLRILQPGSGLSVDTVEGHWQAAHLGPVFGEVKHALARLVRRHCRFMSLDIQGLIRAPRGDGSVRLVSRPLDPILRMCDLVKASREEARVLTAKKDPLDQAEALLVRGPKFAMVTLGREGTILATGKGGRFIIPSYPEDEAVDPTGSGDGFVGSWLATFLFTRDPVWAGSVGSAFASMMLRGRGLAKFRLSRWELFRRSAWVYGRVRPCKSLS